MVVSNTLSNWLSYSGSKLVSAIVHIIMLMYVLFHCLLSLAIVNILSSYVNCKINSLFVHLSILCYSGLKSRLKCFYYCIYLQFISYVCTFTYV